MCVLREHLRVMSMLPETETFKTCGQSVIKQNCGPEMMSVLPSVRYKQSLVLHHHFEKKKRKTSSILVMTLLVLSSETRQGCEDRRQDLNGHNITVAEFLSVSVWLSVFG